MMEIVFESYTDKNKDYSIKLYKIQGEDLWGYTVEFRIKPVLNSRLIISSDTRQEALGKAKNYLKFFRENWLQ